MNRTATASARHHTYLLLSRLFMDGLAEELLPYIAQIPELAEAAPRSFNADKAAATHYGIFAQDIFPYESIFRDPSGLLGGIFADQVYASYELAGFHIKGEFDHIGRELDFLAFLCNGECEALTTVDIEAANHFEQLQSTFLQDHLLCWLMPFVSAISHTDQPFYEALSRMTQSLVCDHLLAVSQAGKTLSDSRFQDDNARERRSMLLDDKTGLKQIASFLITPPHSGFFIGQSTISSLARKRQLPRGFGGRQQMLSNLFHSAAQYDLIPGLLLDLSAHADSWRKSYEDQMDSFPELDTWIRPWLQRVGDTSAALLEMKSLSAATL